MLPAPPPDSPANAQQYERNDNADQNDTTIAIMEVQKQVITDAMDTISHFMNGYTEPANLPEPTPLQTRTVSMFDYNSEIVEKLIAEQIAQERTDARTLASNYKVKIAAYYEVLYKLATKLQELKHFIGDSIQTQDQLNDVAKRAMEILRSRYDYTETTRLNAVQTIDKLVETIECLQHQVSGKEHLVSTTQVEKRDLQHQILGYEQLVSTTQREKKDLQHQIQQYRWQLDDLKKNHQILQQQSQKQQRSNEYQAQQIITAELRQQELQRTLHETEQKLERAKEFSIALEQKYNESDSIAHINFNEWQQLDEENKELIGQLEKLQQQAEVLQAEKQQDFAKTEQLHQQLQQLSGDKKKLSTEKQALTQQLTENDQQLGIYQQQITDLKQQLEQKTKSAQKESAKLQQKKNKQSIQEQQLQSELQEKEVMRSFIQKTQADLESARKHLQQKEAEVLKSAEEIKKLQDELATLQQQTKQTDVDKLKKEIEDQQVTIKRILREKEKVRKKYYEKEKKNNALLEDKDKQYNQTLEKKVQDLQLTIRRTLKEKLKTIEEYYAKEKKNSDLLADKDKQYNETIQILKKHNAELKLRVTEQQEEISQINTAGVDNHHKQPSDIELTTLKNAKAESDEQIKFLQQQLALMESEIAQLQEQKTTLEQEVEVMKLAVPQQGQDSFTNNENQILIDQYEEMIGNLHDENERLQEQLLAIQNAESPASLISNDFTASAANNATEIQQLQSKIQALNEHAQTAKDEINELQRTLKRTEDGYEKEKNKYTLKTQKLQDENQNLREQLQFYESETTKMDEKLKKSAPEKERIQQLTLENQQLQATSEELSTALDKEVKLRHQYQHANATNKSALDEITKLNQQLGDSKQQQQALMGALAGFVNAMQEQLTESDQNTMQEMMQKYFRQFTDNA